MSVPIRYTATHRGWLLLAPVLIADWGTGTPVLIPHHHWNLDIYEVYAETGEPCAVPLKPSRALGWWLDLNVWVTQKMILPIISILSPEACSFMIYAVKEFEFPVLVEVDGHPSES